MNKLISTENRIFMCVVGPSECGKTRLIFDMLTSNTFYKPFDKIYYCYRHWQGIYDKFRKSLNNIEFIQLAQDSFEIVDSIVHETNPIIKQQQQQQRGNAKDNVDKYRTLMIFDDVAEELLRNDNFSNLATSGRHKNISVIFIKHNLYQQGKHSVTIDKNTTHLILMKNPRVGRQLKILGTELGNMKFLEECYQKAVEDQPFGHLLIDLTPSCIESLRYCSGIPNRPSFFWLPRKNARTTLINDKNTNALYSGVYKQSF